VTSSSEFVQATFGWPFVFMPPKASAAMRSARHAGNVRDRQLRELLPAQRHSTSHDVHRAPLRSLNDSLDSLRVAESICRAWALPTMSAPYRAEFTASSRESPSISVSGPEAVTRGWRASDLALCLRSFVHRAQARDAGRPPLLTCRDLCISALSARGAAGGFASKDAIFGSTASAKPTSTTPSGTSTPTRTGMPTQIKPLKYRPLRRHVPRAPTKCGQAG